MMQAGPMMNKAGEEIKELHEAFNELHTLGMMKIEIKKYLLATISKEKIRNNKIMNDQFLMRRECCSIESIYSTMNT